VCACVYGTMKDKTKVGNRQVSSRTGKKTGLMGIIRRGMDKTNMGRCPPSVDL
jgi:hypothetical protein